MPMNAVDRGPGLHPLHAVLLAAAMPLFLGALIADIAYGESAQVQWTNFASWLIAGGLVFAGAALLWAVVDLVRRRRRPWLYVLLLLATVVLGLVNALEHAKDGWAAMPGGLILSVIVGALVVVVTWIGFFRLRVEARS